MQLRGTIGLLLLWVCAPVFSLDLQGMGITLNNWGLTQKSGYQPSLYIAGQDWWQQTPGTHKGIHLDTLRSQEDAPGWPINLSLSRQLIMDSYDTSINAAIGIQNIDVFNNRSPDGLQLSLGGEIGINETMSLYGLSTWMPGLLESGGFDTLSGLRYETGIMLNPLPFLSIRAAYRKVNLNYSLTDGSAEYSSSQGLMIGTGIHW